MIESRVLKIVIGLGVPGLALGVFLLLMRRLGVFTFDKIGSTWAAIIVVLFIIAVVAVTLYALNKWAPKQSGLQKSQKEGQLMTRQATALQKQFHAGSTVLIPPAPQKDATSEEGIVAWKKSMNDYCGLRATVIDVSDSGAPAVRLDVDSGENWWSVKWLHPL
jgi:hypothetical protein